jgi:ketosteroid isomerase-like protein
MGLWRSAVLAVALLASAAGAAPADPAFEAAVEQSHKALAAILRGDPSGYAALFADRDDVTLGNPFGPYAKGKAAVLQTLAGAAAKYRDGDVVRVDRIALYGDGNIIGLVEVEHLRAYRRPVEAGAPPCRPDHLAAPGGLGAAEITYQ